MSQEVLKWVVVGVMVFGAIVALMNMDRDQPEDEEDGPQVLDEDDFE